MNHARLYGLDAKGILLRRSYPELEEIEARCFAIFSQMGATLHKGSRTWAMPWGSTLRLRHLRGMPEASLYQGHSYTWIGADELTSWASPEPLDLLRATLRSPAGIPCSFRVTGNPGGAGHNWVKERYIDPAPPYQEFYSKEQQTSRMFIPSTLDDNLTLMRNDPGYWQRIEAATTGNPALLKAWRYGLWDIVAGGMFDDVWERETHVLAPFVIPQGWRVDRSLDWGSSKPFCILWYAEANGEAVTLADGTKRQFPRGTLFVIAEEYGYGGKSNVGMGGEPIMLALKTKAMEARLREHLYTGSIRPGPGDDPIFDSGRGRSMADVMRDYGVAWEHPSKGPGSRITGWNELRARLSAAAVGSFEQPGLYVFNSCLHLIRTLPTLPRDPHNPDDCDTEAEDHAPDALRLRILAKDFGGQRLVTKGY
jgi:hypothetical protein